MWWRTASRSSPNGALNLPNCSCASGRVTQIRVGVLEHERAAREVRHDPEVENAGERALDDRAHAPEEERVRPRGRRRLAEEARVELRVAADLAAGTAESGERMEKPSVPAPTTAARSACAASVSASTSSLRFTSASCCSSVLDALLERVASVRVCSARLRAARRQRERDSAGERRRAEPEPCSESHASLHRSPPRWAPGVEQGACRAARRESGDFAPIVTGLSVVISTE